MLKPKEKMPVADAAAPVGGACPHGAVLWSFPGAEQQQRGCTGLANGCMGLTGSPPLPALQSGPMGGLEASSVVKCGMRAVSGKNNCLNF